MPRSTARSARIVLAPALGLAVGAVAALAAAPAQARVSGDALVISEVYGAGGNSGAALNQDFVELYNPTSTPIQLGGLSVQYRSATGTANPSGVVALTGSVAARGHFLLGLASGSNGSALPTPDQVNSSVNLSGTSGTVFLANQTGALTTPATGSLVGDPAILDLVGFGTSNTYEGTVAPAPSATASIARTAAGADSDVNGADFTAGAPTPANGAARDGGPGGGGTTPPATEVTIAQLQGTDTDTSPYVGQTVTTTGVVTAAYSVGGLNGFFLQTGGSGGASDSTPGASDAVFVYGSGATGAVHVGESVTVTGAVSEFQGETELSPANTGAVSELSTPLAAVVPAPLAWSQLDTDAARESHEGELLAPQGDFTVTDNYNTNFYGSIELAAGTSMLRQPTDVGTPGSDAAKAQAAYNRSHAIVLDDGSTWSYTATSHSSDPLPWLTPNTPVSDGAAVSFHQPVVLDYRNKQWSLQPRQQVVGDGSAVATFSDMRTAKAKPAPVGGDARLATFNMENFFTTTGQEFVAENPGATCTYYKDRAGTPVGDNRCAFADGSAGPRGAATDAAYQKQLAKEVVGINGLGASIVSLEEVENAAKFGESRDATLAAIVDALNAADGAGTWAYVPSPAASDLPPLDEQDVIRTAFIYRPSEVTPVGVSHVLTGDSDTGQPFSIAREPLAQAFKAAGTGDANAFLVVANHLKSKGTDANGLFNDCANGGDAENTDPAYDQGGFNCTRVHQVKDMWAWAQGQATNLGTDRIFLLGDFNAYDHEDPMEYLYAQGLTELAGRFDPAHSSYSYGGLEGSLDHVLASPAALAMVTGATIWQIDAQESVAYSYSRDNYNVTNLYDASNAFATSDHDPEIIGLTLPRGPVASTVRADDTTAVYSQGVVTVRIAVTAAGAVPTGEVSVREGSRALATGSLSSDGTVALTLPAKSLKRGTHTLTVDYAGDAAVQPGSSTVTVTVTNPAGH